MKKLLLVSCVAWASQPIMADDFLRYKPADSSSTATDCSQTEEGCEGKWDGSIEFGFVAVTGNQDTESLNARLALQYEREKWRHQGFVSTVTSSSEESDGAGGVIETDAEKITAQLKSDYKYSERAYAFGILDYDDTKDSGFEYQASLAFGMGYSFIKDDTHTLDGELGVGSRVSKTEATDTVPSDSNTETISRLAGIYKYKISENSEFEQKLSTEIGDDNTISKSYSGLSANVMENLALKMSYQLKHQSDVPPGNEKTETITSFTVVYSF